VAPTIGFQRFRWNQPRFATGQVKTKLVGEVLPQLAAAQ